MTHIHYEKDVVSTDAHAGINVGAQGHVHGHTHGAGGHLVGTQQVTNHYAEGGYTVPHLICQQHHSHGHECYNKAYGLICHENHNHHHGCYTTQGLTCGLQHAHGYGCYTQSTDYHVSHGHAHIEKIYEKPVVITHHEQSVYQSTYEGKTVERHELAEEHRTHTNQAIIKEIHQDVIHEHHKDVVVEHKKDIVHEHHQNIIHEHHQPVVIEKHIHEHHQPIIHEKHTTLVEEKHLPIVHETHIDRKDQQHREVRDEVYEKAVVETTHSKPIVTEVVEKTHVISEGGHTHGGAHTHGSTHVTNTSSSHTHGETHVHGGSHTHTTGVHVEGHGHTHGTAGAHGQTYVHETLVQDGQLLEDEEWIVDEHGQRRKAKRGFFGNLKDKITGHHQ